MEARRAEERVRRIRSALDSAGLEAVVCALPENVLLLSGYWPVVGDALAYRDRDSLSRDRPGAGVPPRSGGPLAHARGSVGLAAVVRPESPSLLLARVLLPTMC